MVIKLDKRLRAGDLFDSLKPESERLDEKFEFEENPVLNRLAARYTAHLDPHALQIRLLLLIITIKLARKLSKRRVFSFNKI